MMTGGPLFIVGCGRSGTTMLRLMIDGHPEMAIPPESHFIPPLWHARQRYGPEGRMDAQRLVADILATPPVRLWELPAAPVLERVASLARPTFASTVEAVFMAYADTRGARRWGDKTPVYVMSIPLLARLWPEARFVHVIRDGRDVAPSLVGMQRWGPRTLAGAARTWRDRVRTGRRAGRNLGPARYVEVRYERLVDDTEEVLREVASFAGLGFHPDMLNAHERAAQRLSDHEKARHRHEGEPPTRGLRDWRRDLTPEEVLTFEAIAGPELSTLGYERAFRRLPLVVAVRSRVERAGSSVGRALGRVRRGAVRTVRRGRLPTRFET